MIPVLRHRYKRQCFKWVLSTGVSILSFYFGGISSTVQSVPTLAWQIDANMCGWWKRHHTNSSCLIPSFHPLWMMAFSNSQLVYPPAQHTFESSLSVNHPETKRLDDKLDYKQVHFLLLKWLILSGICSHFSPPGHPASSSIKYVARTCQAAVTASLHSS